MPLAVGGGVLVLLGAGAVLVARRRKSAQVPPESRRAHNGPGSLRKRAGTLGFSRRVAALTLAGGLLTLAGCAAEPSPRPSPTSPASPSDPPAYAAQIVHGTNDVRAAKPGQGFVDLP